MITAPAPNKRSRVPFQPSAARWIAIAVAISAACGSDDAPATDATTGDSGPTFSADSGGGEIQVQDTGAPPCAADTDCATPTPRCNVPLGTCAQCVTAEHCKAGEVCTDSTCLPAACKAGQTICKDAATLGTCNAGGDGFELAGCGADKVCHQSACHDVVCKPGAAQCASDNRALLTCNASGIAFAKTPCLSTETCVAESGDEASAVTCKAHICKPGKKVCSQDSKGVRACAASGLSWADTACADGSGGGAAQTCDPGYDTGTGEAFCADQVCSPGTSYCAENIATKCAADGLGTEVADNCNLNSAAGKPRLCSNGACVDLKCKPGAVACLSWASVGKCQQDGQAWVKNACGQGHVCQDGKCVVLACDPGKTYCNGSEVKQCNAFGTGESFVTDCSASGQTCFKGSCSKVICKPGEIKCSDDNKVILTCGPNGYEYKAKSCDDGFTCVGSGCVKQICVPAKLYCEAGEPKQCNGYGTQATPLAKCAAGTFCHLGACKKKICTAGELRCKDTTTLEKCDDLGVAWEVVGCGASQVCSAKACKKKVCEPKQYVCDGQVSKQCAADGLSVAKTEDCAKAGKACVTGKCIAKFCGDGDCNVGVETCTSCEQDCGKCPPTGCEAMSQAGCDGCTCEACVCQIDPFCCSQLWSGLCAQICQNQCGATCKP